MQPEDLIPLIDNLPPQVRAWFVGFLALLAVLLIGLLLGKAVIISVLGPPQANDPQWKLTLYQRLAILDAITPATILELLEIARKEKVIRDLVLTTPRPEEITSPAWNKAPSQRPHQDGGL